MKSVYMLAGEQSGDSHAAALASAIRERHGDWPIYGVAGPAMRDAGVIGTVHSEQLAVMGFTDVIKHLPRLIKIFKKIRSEILNLNPDMVVFIDYPVFNIKMAKALRKKGYQGKLVHYISPSVWAHGKERIRKMAQSLDMLLTIFPFEPSCYEGSGLETRYVGNPLVDSVKNYNYDNDWTEKAGLAPDSEILAIFPGSRHGEIKRNLPIQIKAAKQFAKDHPNVRFAISCAHPDLIEPISKIASNAAIVPARYRYELMRDCQSAIATSGTVTLELALHEKPTVVNYALTRLNKWIAKYILKLDLPHYCIVNIIKNRTIFPEIINQTHEPSRIAKELDALHTSGEARTECINGCRSVKDTLTDLSASDNAAKSLEQLLAC